MLQGLSGLLVKEPNSSYHDAEPVLYIYIVVSQINFLNSKPVGLHKTVFGILQQVSMGCALRKLLHFIRASWKRLQGMLPFGLL